MRKLVVIGHVGNDATIREVSGKSVINFSVADSEKYKDNQGVEHQKTTWFECSIWKDQSQSTRIAAFIKKGNQIYVEGTPDLETYEARDGSHRAKIKVRVTTVTLLSGNKEQPENNQQQAQSQSVNEPNFPEFGNGQPDDDLPF
jgi:single-strand DNA-binding protein